MGIDIERLFSSCSIESKFAKSISIAEVEIGIGYPPAIPVSDPPVVSVVGTSFVGTTVEDCNVVALLLALLALPAVVGLVVVKVSELLLPLLRRRTALLTRR